MDEEKEREVVEEGFNVLCPAEGQIYVVSCIKSQFRTQSGSLLLVMPACPKTHGLGAHHDRYRNPFTIT